MEKNKSIQIGHLRKQIPLKPQAKMAPNTNQLPKVINQLPPHVLPDSTNDTQI